MSVKDKIIFGLMFVLLIGGGYIQYSYTENVKRMAVLEQEQLVHVDEVNQEFRSDLKKLNLEFIGRGKHVHQNQLGIAANKALIKAMTDSLASLIDDLKYTLGELDRSTQRKFTEVGVRITDLTDDVEGERRRNNRKHKDLETSIEDLTNRLASIENMALIQKEKAAEAAAKAAKK